MSIEISINSECRIVPVRFERGISHHKPDKRYPFVDDRGFNHDVPKTNGLKKSAKVRGAVVGMAHNHEVEVKLVRENIADGARLVVTSSNTSVFEIVTPAQGICPVGNSNITIKSSVIEGSKKPKTARLEVRFKESEGPVIATLLVYVFPIMLVKIKPHIVSIHGAGAQYRAITMLFNPDRVGLPASGLEDQLNQYFYNAGIQLERQPTEDLDLNNFTSKSTLTVKRPNKFEELNKILKEVKDTQSIRMYFVNYLEVEASSALAFAVRRPRRHRQLVQSCIVVGLRDLATGDEHEEETLVAIVAHEIGHFLGIQHPFELADPRDCKQDSWTIRTLMHPTIKPERDKTELAPQPEASNWNDFNFMQGQALGAFIPMKNVFVGKFAGEEGLSSEAQCTAMRNFVAKKGRKLYL